MRILHLIGNGFDLNLGLETSYLNFYLHYILKDVEKEHLKRLVEDISKYINKKPSDTQWADLEIGLGDYTKQIKSEDEFLDIYQDMNLELKQFIKQQEEKLEIKGSGKLKDDLIKPAKNLRENDKILLQNYYKQWGKTTWYANIITFNYTNTIEKLLDYKGSNDFTLGRTPVNSGYSCLLQSVKHIHGNVNDKSVLLGVDNLEQVRNENLRSSELVTDLLVKPQSNEAIGRMIDKQCEKLIQDANLICLFGLSLGDSDKKWWNLIGEQLKKEGCRLIYFVKGEDYNMVQLIRKKINESKDFLLSKTNLTDEEKLADKDKIFVGYNCEKMLNLK